MSLNAVVYCRVSTVEQVANMSLRTQRLSCADYCKREGLTVVKVFEERGESAKTIDRTALKSLMQFCRKHKGKVDYIVIHKIDRLARAAEDFHTLRGYFGSLGIHLRSATEPIEDNPFGKLTSGMLALFAEFDNDIRAERALAGMKEAVAQGRWQHQPPTGYTKSLEVNGPSLVHDPVRAPLVQRAFAEYAGGRHSLNSLCRLLNAEGLTTRRGNPLRPQTLKGMLSNKLYLGIIVEKRWGVEVEGDFEPIIDADTWSAAQAVQHRSSKKATPRLLDNPAFPLRRFVVCSEHGVPFTGSYSKGRNNSYGYYRCRVPGCTSAPKSEFEQRFLDHLTSVAAKPEYAALFKRVVLDVWKRQSKSALAANEAIERRIRKLEKRRSKLTDAYLDETLSDENFTIKQSEIEEDLALARLELREAQVHQLDVDGLLGFTDRLLTRPAAMWRDANDEDKRAIQRLVYPQGIQFDGTSFGTAGLAATFSILGGKNPRNVDMVGHIISSWNRVGPWLQETDRLRTRQV